MAMFSRMRGLFGAPMTPGYGGASPAASPLQVDATAPTYTKPSTANLIIGTIGDTLSQIGGGQGTYLPGLQMRQQAAAQAAQYQRQRADKFADWRTQYDYEAAHPKAQADDNFTRTLRNAGIDPASPEAMALYRQKALTDASPAPNFVSDGAGGGRWVTPPAAGMGMGAAPQAPVGKLTPLSGGGASRGGARSFPIR